MLDPSTYTEAFEREHGCTEAEWLRWLPGAVDGHTLALEAAGAAAVQLPGGRLRLQWLTLPPRRIALIRMPRLQVSYRFDAGIDAGTRVRFMRRFDLFMQRGGG